MIALFMYLNVRRSHYRVNRGLVSGVFQPRAIQSRIKRTKDKSIIKREYERLFMFSS